MNIARAWRLPGDLVRIGWRRVDRNLMVRLVTSFNLLALVTVSLAAGVAFLRVRSTLRNSLLQRLTAVAYVKEGELNRWVDEQRNDLVYVSGQQGLRDQVAIVVRRPGTPQAAVAQREIVERLEGAAGVALDMDELFVLSAVGGRVLASTDARRVGDYRVTDLFFVRGRTRTVIQNVYPSPVDGRPTMTIATPVRDASGQVVAVLAGHLNLQRIDSLLADRTGLGRTGEAYLVTPTSDFLSARRFGRAGVQRGVHSDGVDAALAGENDGGEYVNYAGVPVLGAYRWNPQRALALMVEMSAQEAFAPARQLLLATLLIGLGAAVVATTGVYLIARRITQPILAVAHTASEVAAGRFDAVAPVVTRDEVGVLARAFNAMTSRLNSVVLDLHHQVEETSKANRALKESQQLLQAVVDNSANLIVALDTEGRYLLVNRRFEDLFHMRHADIVGHPPNEVLPADQARIAAELVRDALQARTAIERDVDIRIQRVVHHFHVVAFPLSEPGQAPFGVGLIGVDLSERTRAEDERRRLEAGVQQAQKLESLGLLAGGIAHDFNNILTAIVGGTSLALQELGPSTPVRADLEQVVTSAERAAKLTRQMLAYAGRASFAIETFDLNDVIREIGELIAVSVPKQVTLAHELTPGISPITADRTQVSQVVLNLITNAAEATAPRGGRVVVRTGELATDKVVLSQYRFVPAQAPSYVELVVEDNGSGMSAETLDKVFDPFFSTKGSGRGLGLAAVLGIVRQSGGTLKVVTRPDAGTRFSVLIPAAAAKPAGTKDQPAAGAAAGGAGTVLLVDDEDIVRGSVRRILERAGYVVIESQDGSQAVDVFRSEGRRLDAVILDVTMPVMGGAEAFQRMRAMGPSVPVIVSSGYDQQDTASAFKGDAVTFLQKPYRPEQLLAKLRGFKRD